MELWVVSAKELILASCCNYPKGLVTSMMGKDRQLGWQSFQLLPLSQTHWLCSGGALCSCASLVGFAEKKHLEWAAWWVRLQSGHHHLSGRVCFHCFWQVQAIWFWFCPFFFRLALYLGGTCLVTQFLLRAFPSRFSQQTGPLAIQLFPFFLQHKDYTDKSPKNNANDKRCIWELNSVV